MKILFLYTEIAAYTMVCVEEYLKMNPQHELLIIRYPVNNEAPFELSSIDRLTMYIKPTDLTSLNKMVDNIQPDLIICSGWSDRMYLEVCKSWKKRINITLMFDNYWEATPKQYLASVVGRFFLKRYFNNCWVPGQPQVDYAKKLGFKESDIFQYFYSADTTLFNSYAEKALNSKKKNTPHVFLYVGRYLELKGVLDLWNAFIQFQNEHPNDWELWCVGTGELYDKRVLHPKIKHFGFVQPKELSNFIEKASVFVMPSHYDHWGVAVQEFAAAGFPLICSNTVGATSAFLIENKNGYIFKAKDVESLKKSFFKILDLSSEELFEMGKVSNSLSKTVSPQKWSDELNKIIKWKKY